MGDTEGSKKKFNGAHENSLLARTIGNPELKKRYDAWMKAAREDSQSMERWARGDFQSGGEETREADDG